MIDNKIYSNYYFIVPTILFALMLELLPIPGIFSWLRPEWVFMISIYWLMVLPQSFGILSIFLIGLLLDLSNGTLFGEHALAIVIVSYFIIKFHNMIRAFSLFQQTLIIFSLLLLYKLIIFIMQGFIGQLPNVFLHWLSIFTSAIIWPWVTVIMNELRTHVTQIKT